MTLGLVLLFGVGMSVMMGCYVIYYRQNIAAKNSAMILARVMPSVVASDELYARAIAPERLAKQVWLQKALTNAPVVGTMANLLTEAGSPMTVVDLAVTMVGSGVGLAIVSLALGCSPPGAAFLGLVSMTGPIFYFQRARAQRVAAFEAQLPQMLEMLVLYLRTGRSLPQAFTAVADEIPAPASEELALCAEEYRLGRPLPIALKGLSQKYPESLGLKLFAIAISVLGQTGGNLVEVLDRIRRTLESSITYVLKLRAMTGEVRTSATILGALPGIFMVFSALANPVYFNQFFDTTVGLVLLGIFCTCWGAGVLWLKLLLASKA